MIMVVLMSDMLQLVGSSILQPSKSSDKLKHIGQLKRSIVNEHDRPLLEIEIQNYVARATQNQINCRSSPPFR